jgi:drug/metabolite transporter (DMT)-like permease
MGTEIAITLAVVDSICFAAAAVCQQRAVRDAVGQQSSARVPGVDGTGSSDLHPRHHRLKLRGLLSLSTHRGWLAGVLLMAIGAGLHLVALVLAPVSVVQPIGVLGVPIAVLLAAKLDRHPPARATAAPIAICILSIAAFVWLAASQVEADRAVELGDLLLAEVVLLLVVGLAVAVARRVHGWSRCLVNAIAGAMAVGMVAALMRAIAQHLQAGNSLTDGGTLAMAGLVVLNAAVGGWLVQQAYASGRAEVVLACLTVIDPMVAVLIGLVLLGEGAHISGLALTGMISCGVAAVGGVIALARSHPSAAPSSVPTMADNEGKQLNRQLMGVGGSTRG